MTRLTVSAAQIIATDDPGANLELVREATTRAADAGAQVVVFPEATMARFGSPLRTLAQPSDGPFADGVRGVASEHGVLIVAGMFTPGSDGRVRNTLLATGAGVEASYDKIHLYDAFGSRESDTVEPGVEYVTVDAFGVRIGLATCYDLRFADQFTALGRAGAQVVCLPACWADGPGKAEQWDVLVRARALDAQAWLVACDMAWTPAQGPDPLGLGRSAVIDPLGGVRVRLGHTPDVLVTTVDTALVESTRARVPIL